MPDDRYNQQPQLDILGIMPSHDPGRFSKLTGRVLPKQLQTKTETV